MVEQINFNQSGNTITLSGSSAGYAKVGDGYEWQGQIGGGPVTVTGDYTLALGTGMTASEPVTANYSDGTLTTAGTTAGYELSDNSITYTAGTSKQIQFSGVADEATAANFYVNAKTNYITVGKEAVKTDGTPVELLTDGYKLKLGIGMAAPSTNGGTLSGDVYTYGGETAGYTLADKSITYTAGTSKTINFSGVASELTVPADGIFAFEVDNFSSNVTIDDNAGEFRFMVNVGAGADTVAGSTGADFIGVKGTNLTINTGAGNDTLVGGSGNDTFIYKPNEGTDTGTDFASGDLVQIVDGTFSDSAFSGGKLTLTIQGGGSVIFTNVSETQTFNINGTEHTISDGKLK